ncbi:PRC-barrel domain-containing protein [Candidatus Woesearchaeota archaeon]|nr:PRC-barrel domain-containing protein [Candidatus Woesearchaeota archaeon]
MLKSRKVTDVFGMRIFTDDGHYYGDVEEAIFQGSKVYGWRVKATKNSQLSRVLSGARGVTIPHQLVKAVGDIMIVSKSALPSEEVAEETAEAIEEY